MISIDKNSLTSTAKTLCELTGETYDDVIIRISGSKGLRKATLGEQVKGDGWVAFATMKDDLEGISIVFAPDPKFVLSKVRNIIRPIEDGALCIGPRDPRANTAFTGDRMIAEKAVWDDLARNTGTTFEDVRGTIGYCVTFHRADERKFTEDALAWRS